MNKTPFSDSELTNPAKSALTSMMSAIPQPEECDHEFSSEFEEKMQDVFKKERRRRAMRRASKRVAMLFLVCCVTAGVYLGVDTGARAAFFGWIREHYENYFVYCFSGDLNPAAEPMLPKMEFKPEWLPGGYVWDGSSEINGQVEISFKNQEGDELTFGYMPNPAKHDWTTESWEMDLSDMTHTEATVNGYAADLFVPKGGADSNILMWTSYENDAAFYVSGPIEVPDLLRVAESVKLVNGDDLPEADGFRLAWLPDGYELLDQDISENKTHVIYADEQGRFLKFTYMRGEKETDLFVDTTGTTLEKGQVHGQSADLLISHDPDVASAILWTGTQNDAFYISAFLEKDDLIRLAESVVPFYGPLYQASWVPEGYKANEMLGDDYDCLVMYHRDDSDRVLSFHYFYSHSGTGMSVYAEDDNYEEETVSINGCHGDFYRSTVENESSMLVWVDEDNGITFSIGGFLDKSNLLKMARSVEKIR